MYGQPACIVSRISGDYKYIDPFTGEEVACDLSNDELHIGLYRTIVNMVYMPKSVHEQNSYLTEYPFYGVNNYINERNDNFLYNTDYEYCFNNKIPFFKSGDKKYSQRQHNSDKNKKWYNPRKDLDKHREAFMNINGIYVIYRIGNERFYST